MSFKRRQGVEQPGSTPCTGRFVALQPCMLFLGELVAALFGGGVFAFSVLVVVLRLVFTVFGVVIFLMATAATASPATHHEEHQCPQQ